MTKSVRIGAKSSFLLVLSASVLYAIGVQAIRSGPGPSSFDGLASLFGMERRAESDRIQSPAADMTVGEPAVAMLAPAVAMASAEALGDERSVDMPAIGPVSSLPGPMAPAQFIDSTLTFQQGVNGYTGTQDSHIQENAPTGAYGSAVTIKWDTDEPSGSNNDSFGLLRFDGLFGNGAGQIPVGSTITSATLTIVVSNASTETAATISEVAVDWTEAATTWSNFGDDAGVQADEYTYDIGSAPMGSGTQTIDVTASLQRWVASPASNFGWIFRPAVTDGEECHSSEATTLSNRPLLSVTYEPPPTSCTTNDQCEDGNLCTTDTCSLGTGLCEYPAVTCPTGQSCDPADGVCRSNPVTKTFRNGVNGYGATYDTYVYSGDSTANNGVAATLVVDGTPDYQALLRFDSIFGSAANQIPPGSTIQSASLTLNISNASADGASFHRMLQCWSDADKWTTFGSDGVQANGIEALAAADVSTFYNATGSYNVNVLPSLQAWSSGAINLGWVLLPNGTDSWQFDSANGGTKPLLTVTYFPPAGCTFDSDCNDNNECTDDVCNFATGFCDRTVNDQNLCTDNVDCTLDDCSCGSCISTDNCPPPDVCNPSKNACDTPPVPPDQPTNPSPSNGSTNVALGPQLCVDVSDSNDDRLDVTFYGRAATGAAPEDFTVVVIPDPQYMTQTYPDLLRSMFQWTADNRAARNIVFLTELGDLSNNGDQLGEEYQWTNADSAFVLLEDPVTTGLTEGIPFGLVVGNHDNNGAARSGGDEGATTIQYTKFFGLQRFCPGTCSNDAGVTCDKDADCVSPGTCTPGGTCKSWLGGRYDFGAPATYPRNTDNTYQLFSASGMDFIVFHLEIESYPVSCGTMCQTVIQWVRSVLLAHPNHRAIISSHSLMEPSGAITVHGQAVYDAVKDLPNVFLTLSGHLDQANRRIDYANDGHPIYQLVQDYQTRPYGGRGWMRRLIFSPENDTIDVETFSPWVNYPSTPKTESLIDSHGDNTAGTAQNHFTLAYDMDAGLPFETIGLVTGAASGSRVCVPWAGRAMGTTYEWYARASDGNSSTASGYWDFTTATTCGANEDCDDRLWCNGAETCPAGTCVAGTPPVCVDTLDCTTDSCNEATDSCAHVPNDAACADTNDCTDDTCDVLTGCVHTADDSNICSDGDACTEGDYCSGGVCQTGTTPVACDDHLACTNDACVPLTGCEHTSNCAVGWSCNPSTGICEEGCESDTDCGDDDDCTTDICHLANAGALSFDGVNDTVSMGTAPGLGAATFTLEAWVKWNGSGTTASSGSSGVLGYPIIAKGRGEFDGTNQDCNYFFAINQSGKLAADFEEGATGTSPGLNHAVAAATTVTTGVWHHVAVTYDGTAWKLYLDGNLDGSLTVGQPPRSDSIQHFGIGTAINSAGQTEGSFGGAIDEVRVWNYARTQAEIQASMNTEVSSGTGLLGRWGMNEGTGSVLHDSATDPAAESGTIAGVTWLTDSTILPDFGDGACAHDVVPGCCNRDVECVDADPCTTDTCDLVSHTCDHAPMGECCSDADCDDGNVCTDDSCNTVSHDCDYTHNTVPCDDGDGCTTGEACAGGVCVGSTPVTCDDGNVCTTEACSAQASESALQFNGSNQYLNFGLAGTHAELGLSRFTIELWFQKTGTGAATAFAAVAPNNAVPLVTKGRGIGDGDTRDENYFLGISASNTLAFNFEQESPEPIGGDNVVQGATNVNDGQWHHAAVTFDGASLKLYVDGVVDGASATLATTAIPRHDSAHSFGIATAFDSWTNPASPAPGGYFAGKVDEVRVWDRALSASEIAANKLRRIPAAPGLVGRWGLDEGTGSTAADSSGNSNNGTLTNGPTWLSGVPALGLGVCVYTNETDGTHTEECEDSLWCNGVDSCTAGLCGHAGDQCTTLELPMCDEANDLCVECLTGADCFDGNACTDDVCAAGVCSNPNNTLSCDDGLYCTTGERCEAGACAGGGATDCSAYTDTCNLGVCNETADACEAQPTNEGGACDDDNACTTPDTCSAGACDGTYAPVAGCCSTGGDCDDGNAGTVDLCTGGVCSNSSMCLTNTDCDDADGCTVDTCNSANAAALEFDGANDYVNLGNDGNTAAVNYLTNFGTGSFTIEGWFRADTATTYMGLFRQGSQNAFPQVVVQFPGSAPYNRIAGSIETSKGGTQVDTTVATQFTLGQWYHYAMVADRTLGAQTLTVYLHDATGALVGSAQTDANTWASNAINDTYTGTSPNEVRDPVVLGAVRTAPGSSYTYYFDGRLDEVRIWDHARTAQQILESVGKQVLSAPGLVHRWAMNEGTGTAVADFGSTPTAAGTLVNGPTWRTLAADIPEIGTGTCEHALVPGCCETAADCNDGNVCTDDACTDSVCVHTNNTQPCDDSLYCNGTDTCADGACTHAGDPCTLPSLCEETANACVECLSAAECDDTNACTTDACLGNACVHTNNTLACDDGNLCTFGDVCSGGACVGSAACDDGDLCTTDVCTGTSVNTYALGFDGSNDYVTFGTAAGLGTAQFTIEAWFKRTGMGTTSSTGTSGIAALVPLVSKGAPQADGSNLDANYVLGINTAGNVLGADFEDTATGLNHPVSGTTPIVNNVWYHAAATYDGTTWRLYLNGNLDATLVVGGYTPRYDSIQHAALGTMLTSLGGANGYFQGQLDEARVWNYARSSPEIQAGMHVQIPTATGLLGRWGLNEGAGTTAGDSTSPQENGTLTNGPTWVSTSEPTLGQCDHTPIANCCETVADCDDANACTDDACTGNSCEHASIADCCSTDTECNDGDVCTADLCELANVSAIELSGSSQHVSLGSDGNNANVNYLTNFGTSSFTIEGWFWADSFTTDYTSIFRQGSQGPYPQVVVQLRTGPNLAGSVEASTTGSQVDTSASGQPSVTLNAWHHFALVVVRDLITPANQRMNLYYDGTLAESTVASLWGTYPINDSFVGSVRDTVLLGAVRTTAGGAASPPWFDGRLDEIRIWDHARTAQEILDHKNQRLLSAPGLVHRWAIDEGIGTTTADTGATPTTEATLVNGPSWRTLATDLPDLGTGTCEHAAIAGCCYDESDCDDGVACTTDACDAGTHACTHTPSDVACSDGDACTTDTCHPTLDCQHAGVTCDDGSQCTIDSCDSQLGCQFTANPEVCSDGNTCTMDTCSGPAGNFALDFNGSNQSIDFGTAAQHPELGLSQFTLEAWIYRRTGGATASSGTGGVQGYPIMAKGVGEGDNSIVDANFFFAIDSTTGKLGADFEEGAGQPSPGLNHPILGNTVVPLNEWHHVAVTYDGAKWTLYLDGNEDGTLVVNRLPRFDSTQRFAVATTTTSTGTDAGFFNGKMDEVRVWNFARPASDILGTRDRRITAAPGLVGRWGLDEGTGTSVADSTGANAGTLVNAPTWGAGALVLSPETCSYSNAADGTECDDGNPCTATDECTLGACGGTAIPSCCQTAADCGDGDSCTDDTCVANECFHAPIPDCCQSSTQCDDFNVCTTDTCSTANDAALKLNGSSQYVNLGSDGNTTAVNYLTNFGSGSFTIEGWFTFDNASAPALYTGIFRQGRQGTNPQVVIEYNGGLGLSVETDTGPQIAIATALTFPESTWHHVAMVVNRATNQLELWLDGVKKNYTDTSAWGTSTISNKYPADAVWLGVARDSTGAVIGTSYLNGKLDEIRTWDYAWTATDFTNYMGKEVNSAPGLRHRWAMNEGSGTTTADTGPTPTTAGTLVGTPTWLTSAGQIPLFGNDRCDYSNLPDGQACDDGDACTLSTTCQTGSCGGGTSVDCSDGNLCTEDLCDAEEGCSNPTKACPIGQACDPLDGQCKATCTPTGPDLCNGLDDDCDPLTVDGSADPGVGVACDGADTDLCAEGLSACVSGAITCGDTTGDTPELCNAIDDDCDGSADEDYPGVGQACMEGVGACARPGVTVCTMDGLGTECSAEPGGGTPELCNGIDDDCDGLTDEDGAALCTDNDACDGIESCVAGSCQEGVPLTCDDNLYCNGLETCDAGLGCQAGTAPTCNDEVACTTDACDEGADACVHALQDSLCSDSSWCNGEETCSATQGCQAGTPVNCDDGVACTTDACDEGTDTCVHAPQDSLCSDSSWCNGVETCSATQGCQAGTPVNCEDGVACTTDACDEGADACVHAPQDSLCTDGLWCNGVETCSATQGCQAGTPVNCDDGVACTTDACDEGADACVHAPQDSLCTDGLWCTGAETCSATQGCQAGTPVNCDDGVACTTDACDEGADVCVHAPQDSLCTDGLWCNGAETCSATLGCQAGTPVNCDDGVACTTDACDEGTDTCLHAPQDSLCSDSSWCNGAETCSTTQGCQAGTPVSCDDGVACTTDACDEGTDICLHAPQDSLCSDSSWCNGVETCSATQGCQAGTPVSCDDGVACTTDACDEGADACVHAPQDSLCTDGLWCTGAETCSATQGCQAGTAPTCNDGVACTSDACDEGTDTCLHAPQDSLCSDSSWCNGVETCSATQGCQAGTPVSCDDGVACTSDACDEGTDTCSHGPQDSLCADGLWCNGAETCSATLGCQAGTPVNCDDGVACTTDACDEGTDTCLHAPQDSLCTDGLWCNGVETCSATLGCESGIAPNCTDAATCTTDVCNDTTDTCDHLDACPTGHHCDPYLNACISNGAHLTLPTSVSTATGGDVLVPIAATTIDGVFAMDLAFTYDPALFRATAVWKTPLTQPASLTYNLGIPGTVDISLFHSSPLAGSGTIFWISLEALGSAGGTTPLHWTEHSLNEGGVPSTSADGSAQVVGCTVQLSMPDDGLGVAGGEAVIPVIARPAAGLGIDLTVEFNPDQLQVLGVTTTPLSAGAILNFNETVPGKLLISLARTTEFSGEGPIADIRFGVKGGAPQESPVYLTRGSIDEGQVTSCLDAGVLETCAIDCNDENYCTFDTCEAGPACGHASSGFCGVGGRVRFYRDSDDGQEPSDPAKPVSNVRVALSGSNTGEAMTDTDGRYAFAGAFGNVVTTPTRIDSTMQLTVSSQDAVLVAKHSVGSMTLTPNQLIAGDVTNNGEVSSFDASAIAKYAVGLLVPMGQTGDHFAVSAAHASDWSFQPIQYQHPLLAGPATADDFIAILYGDVTGNWAVESEEGVGTFAPLAAPAAADAPLAPRTGPAVLYLAEPPVRIAGTNDWKVLLGLRDADGILGLDLALRAGGRVTLKNVQAVGLARGFTALGNEQAGKVALFAASSMRGSGAFLELVVSGSRAAIDRLGTTLSARANEGAIPIRWETTDRGRRPDKVAPRVEGRP